MMAGVAAGTTVAIATVPALAVPADPVFAAIDAHVAAIGRGDCMHARLCALQEAGLLAIDYDYRPVNAAIDEMDMAAKAWSTRRRPRAPDCGRSRITSGNISTMVPSARSAYAGRSATQPSAVESGPPNGYSRSARTSLGSCSDRKIDDDRHRAHHDEPAGCGGLSLFRAYSQEL
jgi:hypothetical protein